MTWEEDGFGTVTDVFVVSDSYEALDDLDDAIEVGIFEIEETSHEIELEAGVMMEDELGFTLRGDAIETDDDLDAFHFVLAAHDPDVIRYVARFINPTASPAAVGDVEFRGVVSNEMQGEDLQWYGDEYSSAPAPLRNWSCTAGSWDTSHMLDLDPETLIHGDEEEEIEPAMPDEWVDANVADMPGPFYEPSGSFGYRELRFANLVNLGSLLQQLITIAAPPGVTATLASTETGLFGCPARFVMDDGEDGEKLRYISWNGANYRYYDNDATRLKVGGTDYGSLWVTYKLLDPPKDDEEFSWLDYDSLADLLYAVAFCLGMFVRFVYSSATNVTVELTPREEMVGAEIYLRDVTKGSIDLTIVDVDGDRTKYVANAWHRSREGGMADRKQQIVRYLENYPEVPPEFAPISKGEQLPLSVSPIVRTLRGKGEDAGFERGKVTGWSILPHNAVFWDSPTARKPQAAATPPWIEYSSEALHTGLYMKAIGRPNTDGEWGVEDRDVYLPVAAIATAVDGSTKVYGRLADYVNDITQRDGATYFSNEYELEVPGLCWFRATPDGDNDWRVCVPGAKITLDGDEYIIVGVKRGSKANPFTTLRLHGTSRMAFSAPEGIALPEPNEPTLSALPSGIIRDTIIASGTAGESIAKHDLVVLKPDGLLYKAIARHDHWGLPMGLALSDADEDDALEVQQSGRVYVSMPGLAPGDRLFLRTSSGTNWSESELVAPTATEDYHVEIGWAESASAIMLDFKEQWLHYPELPD